MLRLDNLLQRALESGIGENIAKAVIERGFGYYRNDRVMSIKLVDGDTLFAGVRGAGDVYMVGLDASEFRYSSCTCPYDRPCKHMAAVYFAYCRMAGAPEDAEAAFRRLTGEAHSRDLDLAFAGGIAAASEDDKAKPRPADVSPAAWFGWMEEEYGETWRKCRHSLHALQPVLQSLKGTARDWPKPLQRLHWMGAVAFVLNQAEKAILTVDSFSRYYHEMSFARMAEPWIEHYYTLALELEPAGMSADELEWADYVKEYAKRHARSAERKLFDWTYLYMAMCERMSERGDWRRAELARMKAETEGPAADGTNATFAHTAVAMMHFFVGEDRDALRHLKQAEFDRIQAIVYPCAAQRLEQGDWEAFGEWMSFLYSRIRHLRNARLIESFVTLCRGADNEQPGNPVWTRYMTDLLPYSYGELSEHWLANKRYEEWADLQMLLGVGPDDLNAQDLKEMAKSAPAAVIPLFHQAVEDWIAARNRQGYRMAVKQLKKLERLYKAEKKTALWDEYIGGLVRKHGRLRALQEELRKGKFVT